MTAILSLGKSQYLGETKDIRHFDGILASTVIADPTEISNDVLHHHENPIISFILAGDSIERINHDSNHRAAGDIRFYRAGDLHQVKIKRFPSRNINFEFEPDFLTRFDLSEEKISLAIDKNPQAKLLFLQAYREILVKDQFSEASIQILAFSLLGAGKTASDRKKPAWIKNLRELLNDRWHEQISLHELSSVINVHPITISKHFTKYFNCTFGEYTRKLRIEKSISLIKNSNLPLTEIAFLCGFADQSHFTRNFKEFTGFLPKNFKKW